MASANRQSELVLLVSRYPKPPFGFRWEIRHFGFGAGVERATRSYPNEEQARSAGETALRTVRLAARAD